MIYYFSGTGNSKYVAQRLAEALDDSAVSVSDNPIREIPDGEPVGFVSPTYFWGLPWLLADFVRALHLTGDHYCYVALTCGGSTGDASGMLEKLMGRRLDARFSVKMPDTWTPMFDVSDKDANNALLDAAEPVIDEMIDKIRIRERGDFDHLRGMGKVATTLVYPFYKRQSTSKFKASDACTGCGLCAKQCPAQAISIEDGKPVWVKKHCLFCLSCLHRCPHFAISYGPKTHKHGQYYNPRTLN